jgi:hypothetical protein
VWELALASTVLADVARGTWSLKPPLGQADDPGAVVAAVLGWLIVVMPLWLVFQGADALVWPFFLRAQRRVAGQEIVLEGAFRLALRVLGVRLTSSALSLVAIVLGALPGYLLAKVGAAFGLGPVLFVGMVLMGSGSLTAMVVSWVAFVFADRFVVLDGRGLAAALRASAATCRGDVLWRLKWMFLYGVCEFFGAMLLCILFPIGQSFVRAIFETYATDHFELHAQPAAPR